MSPVTEDKAAEWSPLHETRSWILPREKELGVGLGSARFLPRPLQEGSQSLFLPILPLITIVALASSQYIHQPDSIKDEAAEGKPPVTE